jgi:hypothetical protein
MSGTIKTSKMLWMILEISNEISVPIKSIRYTGNKIICSIRFNGKIEAPNKTLPFAIPVKIKYQSVHGVTINIIKPICRSICPARNNFASLNVNKGVIIKFIIKAESEKRKSENDAVISFISTFKKIKKSISIRKISIKFPEYRSRNELVFPAIIPIKAERIINNGWNFVKKLI